MKCSQRGCPHIARWSINGHRLCRSHAKDHVWYLHTEGPDQFKDCLSISIEKVKPEPAPRKNPQPPRLLTARGVNEGTVVEFLGYKVDPAEVGDTGVFNPGDLLVCVGKAKDGDGVYTLYACVRKEEYLKWQAAPDKVDGDELYCVEIRKLGKRELKKLEQKK